MEGNSGTKLMTFTVSLSQASTTEVRVNFATANATAKSSDNDYAAKTGTITFSPGQTTKTITVSIKGDVKSENHEQFYVNLSGPIGGTIADGQGLGAILNDDGSVGSKRKSSAAAMDAAIAELMNGPLKKRVK
jgi:chitinase